ncbi:MAG: hypothetical protein WBC63_06720 [Candidatus Bipolaricaulia bacterium]
MPRIGFGMSLGEILGEAIRLIVQHPIILVPAVIPSLWALVAVLVWLIGPTMAVITGDYVAGSAISIAGIVVGVLIYEFLFILSHAMTVALVRDAHEGGYASVSEALEDTISCLPALLLATLMSGLIIAFGCPFLILPGLILAFLLLYVTQAIMVDEETATGAISASFRTAVAAVGETIGVVFMAGILSGIGILALVFVPWLGWILLIPTTAYFTTVFTLLYLERS